MVLIGQWGDILSLLRKMINIASSGLEIFTPTNPGKVSVTDGTNAADIISTNGSYGLVVAQPNHISTDNSTTTPLGAGATFTGTAEDVTNYAIIFLNVYADQASATNGLCIEYSTDGTNWDFSDCYTISATTGKQFSVPCFTRYFRVKYINGAIAQTVFRLQIKVNTSNALESSHRIADTISDQDDATLQKAVIAALSPGGTFGNVNASLSGNLQTTDAENGLAIAKGEVTGTTFTHKFGNAPDFDYGDNEVTIWDGADDGQAWELMNYTYSSSADIDSISSSDSGDTSLDITIVGLDTNWEEVTQTVALDATDSQTRVALSTSLRRVYRAFNADGTDLTGHVIIYVNTALTAGVPTDKTKIRGIVDPVNQQTEMAVYTIPSGYTGYMRSWYTSASGANKTSNYVIRLKSREENKVFRTKHITAIADDGSSYIQHNYAEPEVFVEKTDIEMTAQMTANTTGASISGGFDIVLVAN